MPKKDIRTKEHQIEYGLCKCHQLIWQHDHECRGAGKGNDNREGRHDATNSSLIELKNRKAAPFLIVRNNRRNQIPRNDEEHIDANESAAEYAKPRVKKYDR